MDLVARFFGSNMVLVYFVYGLAYFLMGLAIALETKKATGSKLAGSLWFLAAFAFLHALVEWAEMFLLIPPGHSGLSGLPAFRTAKVLLLVASAVFLIQFGVSYITSALPNWRWLRWTPPALMLLWLMTPLIVPPALVNENLPSPSSSLICMQCHSSLVPRPTGEALSLLATGEVWARYLLYFPGLILTAIAFYLQGRAFARDKLPRIARDCKLAAAAFAVNIPFAGLVVAPSPYFPASILNYHSFVSFISIPPQVFRAAMALIIAFFVVRVLRFVEIEYARQLQVARQRTFQAQIDALNEVNRLKSEFVSNVSHELRTPLNSIIGFSELLLEQSFGKLNDRQLRHVHNIFNSGTHLLQLVNDILDISRIEAARLDLHYESLSVVDSLEAAATMARTLAAPKNISVQVKVPRRLPPLYADIRRFNQIMYNLLRNAVKFTPEGGSITVEGALKDGHVEITVTDTGIGIKPDEIQRIFQPFQQVDSSFSRQFGGTGLGLALTKSLVEMHKGTISVESEIGRGSTFRFCLPTNRSGNA